MRELDHPIVCWCRKHRHKEWSDHASMNKINVNNYDMNVLWKGNIACLWVYMGARTDVGEKSKKGGC
jgi:hypothetical protein